LSLVGSGFCEVVYPKVPKSSDSGDGTMSVLKEGISMGRLL
jgi:hypothetical protein